MDKKRVLILGATGMLGSAVYDVLKDKYDLALTARNRDKIGLLENAYGGTQNHDVYEFDARGVYNDFLNKKGHPGEYLSNFVGEVGDVDFVINGIGITIPFSMEDPAMTFFINGALPHILANNFGGRLIHITTDCVYNGKEGFPYDERSLKTPVDIYGKSKSLGEPEHSLTIRTSIIGPELESHTGLLDWFINQPSEEVNGFAGHYWNGITTKQFGKICDEIMSNRKNYPESGVYHVFSTSVSKYEMLNKFKDKYGLSVKINEEKENKLNRTLSTMKELNDLLNIPSFDEMIDEL